MSRMRAFPAACMGVRGRRHGRQERRAQGCRPGAADRAAAVRALFAEPGRPVRGAEAAGAGSASDDQADGHHLRRRAAQHGRGLPASARTANCDIVHAGDSRVYHFRNADLVSRTHRPFVRAAPGRGAPDHRGRGEHPSAIEPADRMPGHPAGSADLAAAHRSPRDRRHAPGLQRRAVALLHRRRNSVPSCTRCAPREATEMLVGKARQRARGGGDNLSLALVAGRAARLTRPCRPSGRRGSGRQRQRSRRLVFRGAPGVARLDLRPMGGSLSLGRIEDGTAAGLFGSGTLGADAPQLRQEMFCGRCRSGCRHCRSCSRWRCRCRPSGSVQPAGRGRAAQPWAIAPGVAALGAWPALPGSCGSPRVARRRVHGARDRRARSARAATAPGLRGARAWPRQCRKSPRTVPDRHAAAR